MAKGYERRKFMETERIAWHSFPLGDVFAHLGSKRGGLSSEEAKMRLKHFGENVFFESNKTGFSKIFSSVFLNPFFGAAAFSAFSVLLARMYLESAVIIGVSFLGFMMRFFQRIGIEKYIQKISKLESRNAATLRDGVQNCVPFSEIVPGDVIVLRSGYEIPADARIIQSLGLKTEEEKMTGVRGDISKRASVVSTGTEISGRTNTVYGKTFVSDGSGEALVFGTGPNLEIFRSVRPKEKDYFSGTLLERKISKLGKLFLIGILFLSAGILIFGFARGRDFRESLFAVSALSAAAVLSVLYIAGFSAIISGIGKMLSKKCLVKSLSAAEEIGRVSVMIAGGSGLFTSGEPKIAKVLTPERRSGILELNSTVEYASNHLLALTYGVLVFGSAIESQSNDPEKRAGKGDEIGRAFIEAAVSAGIDIKKLERKFKKIGDMPQGGSRKFSVSFRETSDGERWAFIFGRADALISNIKKIQVLNRYENAIPFEIGVIKESIDSMAKSGLSVFAVCSKKIENRENLSNWANGDGNFKTASGLNLVGLVCVKDFMIENSQCLLSEARRAGIRVVLATDDQTLSAKAFGIETGIAPKNKVPEVLEGKEMETFDAKELSHRIRNIDIFSLATREQKLKIAEAWKSLGENVGVFGNSPDDVRAVSEADIGISFSDGADSVRNASGLIILSGGFESFLESVKEGRAVLSNIKKVFVYVFGLSLSEVILVCLGVVFGFGAPVAASQILWANIAVGIFPVSVLSRKDPDRGIMDFPPDNKEKKKIMGGKALFLTAAAGVISALALFGVFVFSQSSLNSVSYARSVTFTALCVNSLFLAFSVGSLSKPIWESSFLENKRMMMFFGLGILISSAAVYIGPIKAALGLGSIGFLEWVIIFGAGILVFLAVETVKWILSRKISNS